MCEDTKTTKATQKYLNELRKTLQSADASCEKVQEWLDKVTHPKNGLTATIVGCANINKQPVSLCESAIQVISLLCQLKQDYFSKTLYRYAGHLCENLLKCVSKPNLWSLPDTELRLLYLLGVLYHNDKEHKKEGKKVARPHGPSNEQVDFFLNQFVRSLNAPNLGHFLIFILARAHAFGDFSICEDKKHESEKFDFITGGMLRHPGGQVAFEELILAIITSATIKDQVVFVELFSDTLEHECRGIKSEDKGIDSEGILFSHDCRLVIDVLVRQMSNVWQQGNVCYKYVRCLMVIGSTKCYRKQPYRQHDIKESLNCAVRQLTLKEGHSSHLVKSCVAASNFFGKFAKDT